MIPALRQQFNANYTPEKYQRLLKLLEDRCGTPVKFRVCETPCFLPKALLDQMSEYGKELIQQLNGIEYRKASSEAIPDQFRVPREPARPFLCRWILDWYGTRPASYSPNWSNSRASLLSTPTRRCSRNRMERFLVSTQPCNISWADWIGRATRNYCGGRLSQTTIPVTSF